MGKNRHFYWSEWRDLNSRPLDPQSSALPTALHPDILFCCASRGQLVYINMTVMKLQPLISIFLKFFCKSDSMKTCWQSPQLYGIISKVFRRRTAFTMERCPSGWRNRSWKPATCKRPWVRIPLSPPTFNFTFDLQKYPRGRRGSPAKGVGWIKPARGFKSLLLRQAMNPLKLLET